MAVYKYNAFRLKRKNLSSPIPGACIPLLALSAFHGASQQLRQGEVRVSYLAWVWSLAVTNDLIIPLTSKLRMFYQSSIIFFGHPVIC